LKSQRSYNNNNRTVIPKEERKHSDGEETLSETLINIEKTNHQQRQGIPGTLIRTGRQQTKQNHDYYSTGMTSTVIPTPSTEDVLNVNVGILGHVDSGKTSLVKTLSTLLSTAALDKSKESRERGMTLDLGFSCFFLPLPNHLANIYPHKQQLQMTLVDCPGHASLIRTIIGGAQIIDMVVLVVDAYKGWQAQTTECLVLAELTSPHLIIALNKVDLFPPEEREERIAAATKAVRQRLIHSKFPNAPMVGVSACIGGEKVAAVTTTTPMTTTGLDVGTGGDSSTTMITTTTSSPGTFHYQQQQTTHNIHALIETIQQSLPAPKRQVGNSSNTSFYFAIDHCFPIKGMGTVLTGTCLSGSIKVNETIEFPTLGKLERKIKSMQMFKRKTNQIQQGDRAGICVSSFDSNLLERGICATPKTVHLLKGAICLIRKIPQFPGTFKNGSKFHVSVGHTTIMATVTFWGAKELANKRKQYPHQTENSNKISSTTTNTTKEDQLEKHNLDGSALGGDADRAGLPFIQFDWNEDFLQQDFILETLNDQTAYQEKETETTATPTIDQSSSSSSSSISQSPLLHWAVLDFQTPVYCPLNSLIIGSRLDTVVEPSTNAKQSRAVMATEPPSGVTNGSTMTASSCRLAFCGRLVTQMDPSKDMNRIRWYTPKERRGTVSRLGDPHERQDDSKVVRYEIFASDLFKKETVLKPFLGMKLVTPQGDVGELKGAFGTAGKVRVYFPAGTTVREGETLIMPFKRFVHDAEKKMHQEDWILPKARPGTRIEGTTTKKKKVNHKPEAVGVVEKTKGDLLENGKLPQAIITGFFTPEDNIRDRIGQVVRIPSTNETGTIAGAFGKAGKCKVAFETGISAEVGTKAELLPRQ